MPTDQATVEAIVRATTEALLERLAPSRPAIRSCPACGGDGSCAVHPRRANMSPDARELAALIDHTLLTPEATRDQIRRLCDEAVRYGFANVCVNGVWAREAACAVAGTNTGVCVVVGFPLGACSTPVKRFEAEAAICDGAREIDMVMDIGGLKSGDDARVRRDIAAVANTVHARGGLLKVIIETGLLTEDEKVRSCHIATRAGAEFIKTSTGFNRGGATVADVELMRRESGPDVQIKASGGIRTVADVQALTSAGASRLGTSRGVAIVTQLGEMHPTDPSAIP